MTDGSSKTTLTNGKPKKANRCPECGRPFKEDGGHAHDYHLNTRNWKTPQFSWWQGQHNGRGAGQAGCRDEMRDKGFTMTQDQMREALEHISKLPHIEGHDPEVGHKYLCAKCTALEALSASTPEPKRCLVCGDKVFSERFGPGTHVLTLITQDIQQKEMMKTSRKLSE